MRLRPFTNLTEFSHIKLLVQSFINIDPTVWSHSNEKENFASFYFRKNIGHFARSSNESVLVKGSYWWTFGLPRIYLITVIRPLYNTNLELE